MSCSYTYKGLRIYKNKKALVLMLRIIVLSTQGNIIATERCFTVIV